MKAFSPSMSSTRLVLLVSTFIILLCNGAFMRALLAVYPLNMTNAGFLVSIIVMMICLLAFVLRLLSTRYTTRPVLIAILLVSSLAAYFMDTYHIIIDETMIQNTMETNPSEALDLFTLKLLAYLVLLGILPSVFVYRTRIVYNGAFGELKSALLSLGIFAICIVAITVAFSPFYASFFREHKSVRLYLNPVAGLYATGYYFFHGDSLADAPIKPIGLDASIPPTDTDRDLVIMVIGEAARADHFSLNGYDRETNPLLKQQNIINFTNVSSCGTTTAISVPCMFSILTRDDYSDSEARSTENILDVMIHAGVNVLWRDNNSDSKSVALRVPYEDYKSPEHNTMCDEECRDEGMLVGLDDYINQHPTGDILIVLHQMGSHGPAYYKRYPKAFEKFTPVCSTNELEDCSNDEIRNTYDNSILYTDYFLSRVIELLRRHADTFEAAMFYMGDHGESLGEKGLYLHGMPYFIAPEEQTRVPAIVWFSDNFEIDTDKVRAEANMKFSHDNLFHTLLGFMEIRTSLYDNKLDILAEPSDSNHH